MYTQFSYGTLGALSVTGEKNHTIVNKWQSLQPDLAYRSQLDVGTLQIAGES